MSKTFGTEIEVDTNTIDLGKEEGIGVKDKRIGNGMSTTPRSNDGSFEDIDREMSVVGSENVSSDNEEHLMAMDDPPLNKWRVIACFAWCFAFGMYD